MISFGSTVELGLWMSWRIWETESRMIWLSVQPSVPAKALILARSSSVNFTLIGEMGIMVERSKGWWPRKAACAAFSGPSENPSARAGRREASRRTGFRAGMSGGYPLTHRGPLAEIDF